LTFNVFLYIKVPGERKFPILVVLKLQFCGQSVGTVNSWDPGGTQCPGVKANIACPPGEARIPEEPCVKRPPKGYPIFSYISLASSQEKQVMQTDK